MDATTFPSQIFWLVIFFALLYLLMSRLALPKMAAVLDKRHKTIEGDLAKASALKNETEAAVQAYEKALADARAKAQGIAAETRAKMTAEMDAERAALEKKIGAKTAEAEAQDRRRQGPGHEGRGRGCRRNGSRDRVRTDRRQGEQGGGRQGHRRAQGLREKRRCISTRHSSPSSP